MEKDIKDHIISFGFKEITQIGFYEHKHFGIINFSYCHSLADILNEIYNKGKQDKIYEIKNILNIT